MGSALIPMQARASRAKCHTRNLSGNASNLHISFIRASFLVSYLLRYVLN